MSTSKIYCKSIRMTNIGTSQNDRLNQYDTANSIETISTDKYLVYVYLFTDILQYFDEQNNLIEENIWSEFIKNDETIILSLIINTDLSVIRNMVDRIMERISATSILDVGGKYLQSIINIIEQLLFLVNYWYEGLPSETEVSIDIKNIIEKELVPIIFSIINCIDSLPPNTTIYCLYEFKKKIENLKIKSIVWRHAFNKIEKSSTSAKINSIEKIYELYKYIYIICINQITYLQEEANKYFEKSLLSRNHTPHTSLLIAFIQLLKNVTNLMDDIPNKYLDYYYTEVLKFTPNKTVPDKAYVNFVLNQEAKPILLKENTIFTAGKDEDNNDIFFSSTDDLNIDNSNIENVYVLESITEENSSFIPKIFDNSALNIYSYDSTSSQLKLVDKNNFLLSAEIGLLIESLSLNLSAGKRRLKILFTLTPASFRIFNRAMQKALGFYIQEELNKKIYESFSVYLSTANGWLPLSSSSIAFSIPNDSIDAVQIFLDLPDEFPALVPYFNHVTHNVSKDAAVKILINKNIDTNFFSLINCLKIKKIKVYASVEKFQDIIVQNEQGMVDITKPFAPFGPTPMQKSSFYIDIKNIVFNDPQNLTLNIKWNHIPFFEDGFAQYYKGYDTILNNDSFKCTFYYYSNFKWIPINNREHFLLFLSGRENSRGHISINTEKRIFPINMQNVVVGSYNKDNNSTGSWNNYLKVELSSPLIGFGYSEYTSILKKLSTVDPKANKVIMRSIPNEPFFPLIKNLFFDYFLESEVNYSKLNLDFEEKIQWYNLSLFGAKKYIPKTDSVVLPKFVDLADYVRYNRNKISIYIGVSKPNLSTMTLHIELEEREVENKSYGYISNFQYMRDNEWVKFSENDILVDKTNRFQCSGIIKFNIPEDYSLNNSFMPANLLWIRISIDTENNVSIPKVKGVFINAVLIERTTDVLENENKTIDSILIAPNSIKLTSENFISDIKAVMQPFSSFGFEKRESNKQLYLRASERLRHKNRPSSIWDYERLILEKFPMIYTVKCINHSSKKLNSLIAPGYITIAVTLKPIDNNNSFIVPLRIIDEIKSFLTEITPSTINIEITNFLYERICIVTEFQLKVGYEKGIYIEKLQKELYKFISPWPEDFDDAPKLGKVLSPTDIIGYMMSREYIEYISEFAILIYKNKSQKGQVIKFNSKYDNITPSYPWSIITSVPKHIISCTDGKTNAKKNSSIFDKGIGNMSINKNFLVGPWGGLSKNLNVNDSIQEKVKESIKNKYLFAIIK